MRSPVLGPLPHGSLGQLALGTGFSFHSANRLISPWSSRFTAMPSPNPISSHPALIEGLAKPEFPLQTPVRARGKVHLKMGCETGAP